MTTPLRFGIVGCRGIAATHGAVFQRLRAEGLACITAATDTNPARATAFTAAHGGETSDTFEALLARSDVDAVAICTPSGLHGRMAIAAARAGKHILSEKPLDVWVDRVDEAIAEAKKAGVTYGGIFQERFTPNAQKVKRAIDAGLFGDIVLACAETKWFRTQEYYNSGAWRGTWDMDAGAFANQGVHSLDKVQWLAGEVVEVLSATLKPGFHRAIEAETLGVVTVRYASGALGTIAMTTLAYNGFPERVDVCGTQGSALLIGDTLARFTTREMFEDDGAAGNDDPVAVAALLKGDEAATAKASDPAAVGVEGHYLNIRDFVLAVRENREPLVSATEARRAIRLLNLIYEKARVGPYA